MADAAKERQHAGLTARLLAWMLSICTPSRPRGRHRLGTAPPLRFIPAPPPRFTEILDGNASRLVRPYVLDPAERRRAAHLATLGIDVGPRHIHGVRIPAVTR
ncbi:hypothetical protein RI578_16930 [Streptomyces sp. BB1-1-1]|uniref:hypothetical protein n=1 Tax=Streptomyces sp. BB1-1-1 TaxID=3074430 RepID=UPI0028777E30|nr:hypothetical protein [Streptomyces sp. BB1-1-1]WND35872.1 hypothetical protein RI578_16930 [Streptomyces sp. BB1-1-1]